jgi:hypothetical protein
MNPIVVEQFNVLERANLMALLQKLLPELEALQQRVAQLEAENAQLKQCLNKSANSGNSSQPPSCDQKSNQTALLRRKCRPPVEHKPHQRVLIEEPTQVVQVPVVEFGPQMEATVVWYKQKQLMSYERLVVTLWERPRHATFGFRNERLRSAVCRGNAPSRNHPSLP